MEEQAKLRDAEARFREAVRLEQSGLMATGVGRTEVRELKVHALPALGNSPGFSRNDGKPSYTNSRAQFSKFGGKTRLLFLDVSKDGEILSGRTPGLLACVMLPLSKADVG